MNALSKNAEKEREMIRKRIKDIRKLQGVRSQNEKDSC